MPRISKLPRSRTIQDASITSLSILDILAPALFGTTALPQRTYLQASNGRHLSTCSDIYYESSFFDALAKASLCDQHKSLSSFQRQFASSREERKVQGADLERRSCENGSQTAVVRGGVSRSTECTGGKSLASPHHKNGFDVEKTTLNTYRPLKKRVNASYDSKTCAQSATTYEEDEVAHAQRQGGSVQHPRIQRRNNTRVWRENTHRTSGAGVAISSKDCSLLDRKYKSIAPSLELQNLAIQHSSETLPRRLCQRLTFPPSSGYTRKYHTQITKSRSKLRQMKFAEGSNLPSDFFDDISSIRNLFPISDKRLRKAQRHAEPKIRTSAIPDSNESQFQPFTTTDHETDTSIIKQMKLLQSVRELEEKLESAKRDLVKSMNLGKERSTMIATAETIPVRAPVTLTKEDYKNLVDLYYFSHNSRFSPESTDRSPTPIVLNDYSFALSSDFSPGFHNTEIVNEDEAYESPLKKIEEMLKQRQLKEIAVMQVFIDLLLDDSSSNRALYEAYKQLPDPGVAYLPKGTLRLFLQRMSVPWTVSEKSMLRYLSLIDDMQNAKLPITVSEWSSAVYLAGRAFSRITDQEVKTSFNIWQSMEHDAGVQASNVTFNILFDIAVRSGRFALGETILKEMHSRNLRLNRLGRVSLMYYHGLRKDGDGVRKAYRDFVEASEIVDTLVMNCVIASLLNAQEPQAAEQTYARMKNMQARIRDGAERNEDGTLFKRYPDPGSHTIDNEMASNHLGRILWKAPHLQQILPEHHEQLQASMPLTPDHTTFRSMVAYHATTSGDLDRITVLLQDMTDFFRLPLQTIFFQLLFKGFALHGPVGGPQSTWSPKRLDLCWDACREAIKESNSQLSKPTVSKNSSGRESNAEDGRSSSKLSLPSISQVNAMPQHLRIPDTNVPLSRPPPRRLSGWAEFVLDLAAFPRERLKRLERFHATLFDAEDMNKPHERLGIHTFSDPFFQSTAYTAPEPQLDAEEGEYELPNPSDSGLLYQFDAEEDAPSRKPTPDDPRTTPHQVAATKPLVCWLIRAYARNTKSRSKVEEIWGQVRKVYKPRDAMERESVVRVLRRCLRDCDQEGSG